ncbi:hypothetical protein AAP_05935 [Ascosphaera apis ARSEF 7405]|uniref:Uncharacterized protein n=1 Tax=Ascosphaera apis ARSEF 7405 TaxID=392613 RepID=A0A166N0W9_9EURO|nr:hypothetical protein AAP_05935 [Ascosphaera apis ARSEF 7405]
MAPEQRQKPRPTAENESLDTSSVDTPASRDASTSTEETPEQLPRTAPGLPKQTPIKALADTMKEAWLKSGNKVSLDNDSEDRIRALIEWAMEKDAAANE